MMLRTLRIFLLLVLSCLLSVGRLSAMQQDTESYRYTAFPSGTSVRLDVGKKQIVIDSHSVLSASVCSEDAEFKCIVGGDFYFAFPKASLADKSVWDYKGQKFRVSRNMSGSILGKRYSAFVIERTSSDGILWYAYSPADGLLAFGLTTSEKAKSTFILEGQCGFGADKNCKQ